MNELALFAGAGGGILGSHLLGWRTVCAVEKEPYCREVLLRRQQDGMLPLFPVWDDCSTFDGRPWRGLVDVVTAGFPCQPFSVAGKQNAGEDERDGWPATVRILGEVRPRFALLENVPGLLAGSHGYFGRVLGDLAALGFDAVWDCFPASAVGAPHRRDRLWVLCYANGHGEPNESVDDETSGLPAVADPCRRRCVRQETGKVQQPRRAETFGAGNAADFAGVRCRQDAVGVSIADSRESQKHAKTGSPVWWQTEPDVGRVVNGLAHRVDRLKALGNGQVAPVVPLAWETLRRKAGI